MIPGAQGARMETHWLNPYRALKGGKRKSKLAKAMEKVAEPWEELQTSSQSENSRGNFLIVPCCEILQRTKR